MRLCEFRICDTLEVMNRFQFRLEALALLFVLLGGCTRVGTLPTTPPPASVPTPGAISPGWTEEGLASWYGNPFHGRTTSSGEVYDMEEMTAAHKTLPFGTLVQVENLTNGRETTFRINDRGPFIEGRVIDLSRRGARELDMLTSGIAPVRLTIIGLPEAGRPE